MRYLIEKVTNPKWMEYQAMDEAAKIFEDFEPAEFILVPIEFPTPKDMEAEIIRVMKEEKISPVKIAAAIYKLITGNNEQTTNPEVQS